MFCSNSQYTVFQFHLFHCTLHILLIGKRGHAGSLLAFSSQFPHSQLNSLEKQHFFNWLGNNERNFFHTASTFVAPIWTISASIASSRLVYTNAPNSTMHMVSRTVSARFLVSEILTIDNTITNTWRLCTCLQFINTPCNLSLYIYRVTIFSIALNTWFGNAIFSTTKFGKSIAI